MGVDKAPSLWYNTRMNKTEITNVSRILCDLMDGAVRLTNKLTLMQAEIDLSASSDDLELEELSENLEDLLNDLANVEVTLEETEETYVRDIQPRLLAIFGNQKEEDDGVYRD
jgi:hypothetical protein